MKLDVNFRSTLLAVGGILAVGLASSWIFGQAAVGQSPAPAIPPTRGQYQMVLKSNGDTMSTVFILNTETGQCWFRGTSPDSKTWNDMGSPAKEERQ